MDRFIKSVAHMVTLMSEKVTMSEMPITGHILVEQRTFTVKALYPASLDIPTMAKPRVVMR